jgi:hypothetical protein
VRVLAWPRMITVRERAHARLLDRLDLLIDLATLGEYGLEPVPEPYRSSGLEGSGDADGSGCERTGTGGCASVADREAIAPARRGACETGDRLVPRAARLR